MPVPLLDRARLACVTYEARHDKAPVLRLQQVPERSDLVRVYQIRVDGHIGPAMSRHELEAVALLPVGVPVLPTVPERLVLNFRQDEQLSNRRHQACVYQYFRRACSLAKVVHIV